MKYEIYQIDALVGIARTPFSAIFSTLTAARNCARKLRLDHGPAVGNIRGLVAASDGRFRDSRYQSSF